MVRVSRDILYAGQELECEEILNRVIEDARVCGMRIVEECDLTLAQDFLQLMRMFDVEHFGLYSEKHKLISKVNLQRARIESFQSLIDDGQYFVTLLQYWKMLRFLDEALFGRLDDLGGALGADEWRRWGLSHPEEVDWVVRLGGDGRYRVNSAFFCFGESMLRMDAFEEETPDVMSRMNSMAAGSLDSFFAACEVAEGIPGPIRSILKDHRGLFG